MRRVYVSGSIYPSCCYYALKQLGLMQSESEPKYKERGKHLSFLGESFAFKAPMPGGPIFTLVYQIPSYLDPQKPDELEQIIQAVERFIQTEEIDSFTDQWPEKTTYWDLWFTEGWKNFLFKGLRDEREKACTLVREFICFVKEIWSEYLEIFHNKLSDYPFNSRQEYCEKLNVFEKWEEEIGVSYPYDDFTVVICPETRTSASSLGPEKIVFSASHSLEVMKNSIIHEVGVRTIGLHRLAEHPATRTLMAEDYHGILMLIETEICYRKPNLIPELKDDPFIKGMKLTDLVAWRAEQQELDSLPESFAVWYKKAKEEGLL